MKAIIYRRYGGPEVLEYADIPDPKLGQNDVLIAVRAAALNPADIALQAGLGDSFMDVWFPVVPGWDVAGVVAAVGAGISEFAPGDEVMSYIRQDILHSGAFAELVSTDVSNVALKPKTSSWVEAAGLPLAGLTASRAVDVILKVKAGETLLLHGAAGGVGVIAAQLAKLRGARVIGSCSEGNRSILNELGIEPVDYGRALGEQVRAIAPDGVDVVLDCVGRDALATSTGLVRSETRVGTIAPGDAADVKMIFVRQDIVMLNQLATLVDQAALRIPIAAIYPLSEAAEAQQALGRRHGPGKIVLELERNG
ncbi:NADP-dependent oxidoreductase [Bradyrhizobium sp. Tv2a-2]|uniref:NADP-dependent oxidoreductase n=1 Tax=Bradyrhizobium sp. Tv2a-2 TaxID=113395 RepID=UPI000427A50C|nr:NADP-dependent oxidoreductase [Bradyrhizobium sp. Tv2a-2]